MPGVFSIFRPRSCTYRSDPDSCLWAYGIAPFGSIVCQSLTTIINGCALCLCAFKMHLFAQEWCLHIFFFRDKGEHSATQSESLWTLQLQHSRVAFSNRDPRYFAIFQVDAGNLRALCFAVCFTPQRQRCPSECLTVPSLIQLDDDDAAPDEDDSSPDDDE